MAWSHRSYKPTNEGGGAGRSDEFFPLVYEELKRLARQHLARLTPGQTLQPTALVHEAYMRLQGSPTWDTDGHFFGAAAKAMRNILVDEYRRKKRLKRDAGGRRLALEALDDVVVAGKATYDEGMVDLDALDEALRTLESEEGPRRVQVVELRFFAGLTVDQTANALGVTSRTVDRDWKFARAWLYEWISR